LSITIGRYAFEGPYTSTGYLEDKSGVYAILSSKSGSNSLIDVGESATVKTRVESHDRSDCWRRNSNGRQLAYAVLYTPNLQEAGRRQIEQEIRNQYRIPCGTY